jgi:hypothetical protein
VIDSLIGLPVVSGSLVGLMGMILVVLVSVGVGGFSITALDVLHSDQLRASPVVTCHLPSFGSRRLEGSWVGTGDTQC